MKKITILINNNVLVFKYRVKKLTEPNLLNTNVISNNELVFSDEYLQNNVKLVGLFICDLAKERNITEINVSNNELCMLILDIIKKIPTISKLTITDNENLTYSLCEQLCKTKNIKSLDCYGIPEFMIETLDKYGIAVNSRNEVLFTSNFMSQNNLSSFSKIYYKNNIRIDERVDTEDLNDIKTFLAINKYLKVIHFEKYSLENIKKIIPLLKEAKRKNISIQIHDDIEGNEDISELKEINKELKRKNKINISLIYSDDYLEKNYLQQIIFTTLKLCALIIFAIIISVLGYVMYNNYQSELKVNNIMSELNSIMSTPEEPPIEEPTQEEEEPFIEEDNLGMINSYHKLYQVNNETVGWLTVNGTKIDYPVVRAKDNKYYLNRNIYKEQDYNGWVFMDYRNNVDTLDDNTIIYAHNRYTSGVMFGTLPNIGKKNWLNNKNNHYITFNTLYKEHKWKVFSIYSIDVTSDYLKSVFHDDETKQQFIDMITSRSEYDFDTKVTVNDKILTLSTCLDNDQRFVAHAVLVE